jgi:two-component system sensor histidine kinase AtoS
VTAANKPRLFEAFFSTRPGGSGLGLAIVKQIVENHGGRIRETGTPGKGGRFEVELPAAPTQENQP